jgi:hypothetical protein
MTRTWDNEMSGVLGGLAKVLYSDHRPSASGRTTQLPVWAEDDQVS